MYNEPETMSFCRGRFYTTAQSQSTLLFSIILSKKRKIIISEKNFAPTLIIRRTSLRLKNWSKQHPDYWKRYRSRNPEYTESNRIAQRNRNTNRHRKDEPNRPVKVIANITLLNHKIQCLPIGYGVILREVIKRENRYTRQSIIRIVSHPIFGAKVEFYEYCQSTCNRPRVPRDGLDVSHIRIASALSLKNDGFT